MSAATTTTTFEVLAEVLTQQFHVDRARIEPATTLVALGLDSLALMEFVFAAEDRFGLRIPEDRLDPRQSGIDLAQLCALIDEMRAAPAVSG